jgi:L-ascorbate metabolism protein UlaG (beta-lactamase superfamily)
MKQFKPLASTTPPYRPTVMQFIGHSCFLIIAPDGTRVVTDPYGCAVPRLPFPNDLRADLVTVSHGHDAHIQVHAVNGNPIILCGVTSRQVGMVEVASFNTLHGECDGRYAGPNRVFVFQIGGAKIVHLGDLGEIESPQVYAAIENADVVLAPVGESGTMSCERLNRLMEWIRARTVVPHHFAVAATAGSRRPNTVAAYITSLPPGTVITGADELLVKPDMPRCVTVLSSKALPNHPVRDSVAEESWASAPHFGCATSTPRATPIGATGTVLLAHPQIGSPLETGHSERWVYFSHPGVYRATEAYWKHHPSRLRSSIIARRRRFRYH